MKPTYLLLSLCLAVTAPAAYASRGQQHSYDYAKVVSVEPIVETIEQREPVEHCWQEQQPRALHRASHTAALLGGILGGAIGNELGHNKSNKRVGAVVGGLLGASIASDLNRGSDRGYAGGGYTTVQRCETEYNSHFVEQTVGYAVSYRYRGQLYHTTTRQHPGQRIKLQLEFRPVL